MQEKYKMKNAYIKWNENNGFQQSENSTEIEKKEINKKQPCIKGYLYFLSLCVTLNPQGYTLFHPLLWQLVHIG